MFAMANPQGHDEWPCKLLLQAIRCTYFRSFGFTPTLLKITFYFLKNKKKRMYEMLEAQFSWAYVYS